MRRVAWVIVGLVAYAGCGGGGAGKTADSADPCAGDPEVAWGVANDTCAFTEDDFLDPDEEDPSDNTLTIGARVRVCDDPACVADLGVWAAQYDGCFEDDIGNWSFAANVREILAECD